MACASSSPKVIHKQRENGLRACLLHDLGRETLLDQLHLHLPKNPVDLYNKLLTQQQTFKKHLNQKIVYQDQYDILLPSNGQTFSKDFDITLIFYLLRTWCKLKAPKTGWKQYPNSTDSSKEAHFVRIKHLRNIKQHKGTIEMTDQELKTYHDEISKPLLALGCPQNDIIDALICVIDNKIEQKYNQEKLRADQENTRANQEKSRANQEKSRADQAEIDTKNEKNRSDKLECCKKNTTYNLLPKLPTFIGRDDEMNGLHTKLVNPIDHQLATVACGMGGVGKSELARAYANDHKDFYDNNVMWINGESEISIEKSFLDIAQFIGLSIKIKLEDGESEEFVNNSVLVQKVYRFFENQKCLFIFDNVNTDKNIKNYLPQSNSGKIKPVILITSQYLQWGNYFSVLSVEVFSKTHACNFLQCNEKYHQSDQTEREELCKLLGYHPLALQQAISYVDVNKCKYSEYASLFTKYPKRLTEESHVFTTFEIAFNNILSNNKNNRILLQIMKFFPFLDGKEIKKGFFLQLFEQDVVGVNKALTILQNFSLINIRCINDSTEENIITIHSLVQEAILFAGKGKRKYGNSLRDFLTLISTTENLHRFGSYTSKHLANVCSNKLTKDDVLKILQDEAEYVVNRLFHILQENYHLKELISTAQELQNRLTCTTNQLFHLKLTWYIANCYRLQGQYIQALKLYRIVESTRRSLFGDDDPVLLNTQCIIANCYRLQGHFAQALILFREVKSVQRRTLRNDDPELLATQHNIANCYYKQEKYTQALKLYKKVESRRRSLFGDDDPELLLTQCTIASCYCLQGKKSQALEIFKGVESTQRRTLGDQHPSLLKTQYNIAKFYYNQGKFIQALVLYKNVESAQKKVFGEDNPEYLKTQKKIANCNNALEHYKIESKQRRIRKFDDLSWLKSKYSIDNCYHNQGKYLQALEELYEKETLKEEENVGDENSDRLITECNNIPFQNSKMCVLL